MSLLGLWSSTRRPSEQCSVLPADAVIYRLLYTNRPSAPFRVTKPDSGEAADLVAEWRLADPCWQPRFRAAEMTRAVRILLKLHPEDCAVHALDQEFAITWDANTPMLVPTSSFLKSAPAFKFAAGPTAFTETVCPGNVQHYSFVTAELRLPLQEAVTECGWTYRQISKPAKL